MRLRRRLSVLAAFAVIAGAGAQELFVAPDGNDAWSGSRAAPDAARADGPFATPARARRAVRELRAAKPDEPVTVRLRGGRYELAEPLVLEPDDSGSAAAPVTWAAAENEIPVLSAGERVAGFAVDGGGRWTARIAAGRDFAQLYVGDQRRSRPRLPAAGYARIAGELPATPAAAARGYDGFAYADGDLDPRWTGLADIEVVVFHEWDTSRLRIAAIDGTERAVRFTGPTGSREWWAGLRAGTRYLVENAGEATRPGEWRLDRAAATLTYVPLPGEDPATTAVVAPRHEQALIVRGDPAAGRFVHDLRFVGLTFADAAWTTPPTGKPGAQADVGTPAAVVATGLRDAAFTGCAFTRTGAYALELGAGCRAVTVASCRFDDLGAGGIRIGTQQRFDDGDERTASGIAVSDCVIAHGGRVLPAGVGVWIGQSHHDRIEHCRIEDLYYSGISLGWTWGYGPSSAHDNEVAWCEIADLGQGVLSDLGGVYTLGVSPGTRIHHDRVHDVESASYGGWGLYTDEGSSGIALERNLVYRTSASGFHQHYGRDNAVRGNVFAFGRQAQLMRTRSEDHRSFAIEGNLVLAHDTGILGGDWSGDAARFVLERNLYWDDAGPVGLEGLALDAWRARTGHDAGSLTADPGFVDPAHDDFTLKADSPAARIGFEPLDLAGVGPRPEQVVGRLRDLPAGAKPPRAWPPKAPPLPIREGFERATPGERPSGLEIGEDAAVPAAAIRVDDAIACAGARSLRFSDAPGQAQPWLPYCAWKPGFSAGRATGSFALRWQPGAVLRHEWRDGHQPYRIGPALAIAADGALTAGGRAIARLPADRWVRIAIATPLGDDARGTWSLTVTPAEGAPTRVDGLPCDAKFRSLDWFGFIADGTAAATFHVDEVAVACE